MEAMVLDQNFQGIFIIDRFESLIWTDRFDQYGDFELYLPMELYYLNFLVPDNYLWMKDSEHLMIIESFNIDSNTEDGTKLIVTGRSLESILDRRIIWDQVTFTNSNFQDAIHTLLNNCIISPTNVDRKIDNFVFKENTDTRITGLTIDDQYLGDNLYDVIKAACEEKGVGFKVILNDNLQFEFSLYVGEDRSYNQTDNPYVVFSPNFDNLISSSYIESNAEYKNVVLVAGETIEDTETKKTVTVGSETGLARRETYLETSVSSTKDDDTKMTDAEYNALLEQEGNKELTEKKYEQAFEGKMDTTRMYVYGEDFFMGDTVQVANEYGIEAAATISELIMSQSESGFEMYPTFRQ